MLGILAAHCAPAARGRSSAEATGTAPAATGSVGVPQRSIGDQPFIELHVFKPEVAECILGKECVARNPCQVAICVNHLCGGTPRNEVPCQTEWLGSPREGICFAGQCVVKERWVETCGRAIGHTYGRSMSISVRKCILSSSACLARAEEGYRIIREGGARDLVRCLTYPRVMLPLDYLYEWDGSDQLDYHGQGARALAPVEGGAQRLSGAVAPTRGEQPPRGDAKVEDRRGAPQVRLPRCALDLIWAQRQADLVPSELNEYGVMYESACIPRPLCMQRCSAQLAKTIAPSIQVLPCTDARDCSPPVLNAHTLKAAEAGLASCHLRCGFPTPQMAFTAEPQRVPDPRPPVVEEEPTDAQVPMEQKTDEEDEEPEWMPTYFPEVYGE